MFLTQWRGDPSTAAQTQRLARCQQIAPAHGVKSLCKIKLHKYGGLLLDMSLSYDILDIDEIVLDAPLFDKITLVVRHQGV